MLETPEERTKLLRAGFNGERIEKLYIECNNFKIIRAPKFIELVECEFPQEGNCISNEVAVECT